MRPLYLCAPGSSAASDLIMTLLIECSLLGSTFGRFKHLNQRVVFEFVFEEQRRKLFFLDQRLNVLEISFNG